MDAESQPEFSLPDETDESRKNSEARSSLEIITTEEFKRRENVKSLTTLLDTDEDEEEDPDTHQRGHKSQDPAPDKIRGKNYEQI